MVRYISDFNEKGVYAMEGFNEQVVKRVNKPKHLIIKIAAVTIEVLIPFVFAAIALATGVQYFMIVGLFIFLFGIYGVWYTFSQLKVDYEYSVAGNDLDVSKIISLRKRKLICQVKINEITDITRDEKEIENLRVHKTFIAARDIDAKDENYYVTFNTPAFGKCLLIFTPNQQILDGMRPRLEKTLVFKLFYTH